MERQSQANKAPQEAVAEQTPVIGRMQAHREAVLNERARVERVRGVLSGELQGEDLDRAIAQVRRDMHVDRGIGQVPSRSPRLVSVATEAQVLIDYLGAFKKPDIS